MSDKIYVEGHILIDTPYFTCPNSGAHCLDKPEGSVVVGTNGTVEGSPCLIIDNKRPQSIFNEYYAKGEYAAYQECANFFYKTYDEAYSEYLQRINDIKEVISISGITEVQETIIKRLLYISIVASVETFVCDCILTKITSDKTAFNNYSMLIIKKQNARNEKQVRSKLKKSLKRNNIAKWEQRIINNIIHTSYSNISTIMEAFDEIFNITIIDIDGKMDAIFKDRHFLAHKNGRKKDGSFINTDAQILNDLIKDTGCFVEQIINKINPTI